MAPKTHLSFRPIQDSDTPFLAALYASTRQAEMAQSGWPQAEIDLFLVSQFQLQHDYYQQHFQAADFNIVVYEGKDIGRLYTCWEKNMLRLIDIALLPEYQGQGFGREILHDLLEQAKNKGVGISLYVELTNPAFNWYSRLGFIPYGDNGVYQQMRWSPVKATTTTTQLMETDT
jgi:ribosomal protein S18 acetylase RimI-like enzyme